MSLCCLICTDEITKSTKLQKINPPPRLRYQWLQLEVWTSYRLSSEDIYFFIFSSSHPPPPPAPVTLSFISLSPSLPLPHLGPPPFFKSPLPITFSPFLLPYMPKICSIASKLFLFMKFQIFHILPGDLTVRSESYFYADVCTPRQYRLRICNQCISMRIAVIFTAHTLWRATLFPLKIRGDKQKKNKKSPFFSLLSPSSPSLSPSFFFLLVTRQGGQSAPPAPPLGTLLDKC